jgi:cytochrome c2
MKKIILSLLILLSATLQANAVDPDISAGKLLFQKNCTSCHAVQNQIVGPALRNVFDRHTEAWIIKFVRSSQTVIKSGDTSALRLFNQFNQTIMPDHPNLGEQDVKNIIGYIRGESNNAIAQLPAAVAVEENDPYKGESGFVRQVVYVDLPGTHMPISPSDYRTWFVIGVLIFLALLTLFTVIKAKTLIIFLNKKYGQ